MFESCAPHRKTRGPQPPPRSPLLVVDYLSLTDPFLVGLALDISGALLLAKGLLVSPALIARLSASYWDANPADCWDRCQNRVDGQFGVGYLSAGFLLQAAGYVAALAGVHTATGTARVAVAVAMALAAMAVAIGAWRVLYPGRVRKLSAKVEATAKERRSGD